MTGDTMRILHVLNHTNRLNGHVHAAVDLACAQREAGHAVAIASGGGDFDTLLTSAGVETMVLDHRRRPAVLAASALALHRLIRRWRPDVVHAHMMTSAVLAWPGCRVAGIPLITTVHNAFQKSAVLMGLGTRVIAVSAAVGASMQARGIPASRLDVVLNGTIGSIRQRGRERVPVTLDRPVILFVGGLHPRKGLPDLLEGFDIAWARHPEARLCIVGDGPFAAEYRAMAGRLACARAVTFAGAQADPFGWMLGADIFVLPSHADPAPLVLPEAREAGCAVIGTDVDGIPQLLGDGRAGIIVPPRDPQAIARALCDLLGAPETLHRWRANSQADIANLTIARVMHETSDVYARALADRGRPLGAIVM
ncbi:glycosyltransferase family 4 protein [Paenirhodobacter sp.]|uniref:glycosyltransferase family 4 protein n=1 Tax=Paenirhodobacter sp. TaxID=1965326 RepID=UPI003B422EFE